MAIAERATEPDPAASAPRTPHPRRRTSWRASAVVLGLVVAGVLVARIAGEEGVPVLVVPGALGPGWEAILPLVDGVEPVVGGAATAEDALARPAELLALTVERALRGWARMDELL